MAVPEAAVYENYRFVLFKIQVGFARKVCFVAGVSEAKPVEPFSDLYFRLGVARLNGAHIFRTNFWRMNVGHLLGSIIHFLLVIINDCLEYPGFHQLCYSSKDRYYNRVTELLVSLGVGNRDFKVT